MLQLSNIKLNERQFLYRFCFVKYMVSSVQNNAANTPQKSQGLHVGVICPPDKFQKVVLYSDAEATSQFKQLNRDVYTMQKKVSFEETKKTPKSVFIIGAGLLLTAVGFAIRFLIKKKP